MSGEFGESIFDDLFNDYRVNEARRIIGRKLLCVRSLSRTNHVI